MLTLQVLTYDDNNNVTPGVQLSFNLDTLTCAEAFRLTCNPEKMVLQWRDVFCLITLVDPQSTVLDFVQRNRNITLQEISALHVLSDVAFAKGRWDWRYALGTADIGGNVVMMSSGDIVCSKCGTNYWNPSHMCVQCDAQKMVRFCISPKCKKPFFKGYAPETFAQQFCSTKCLPKREIHVGFYPLGKDFPSLGLVADNLRVKADNTYRDALGKFMRKAMLSHLIPLDMRTCDFLERSGNKMGPPIPLRECLSNISVLWGDEKLISETDLGRMGWPFPNFTFAQVLSGEVRPLLECFDADSFMCVLEDSDKPISLDRECATGPDRVCFVPKSVHEEIEEEEEDEEEDEEEEEEEEKPRRGRKPNGGGKRSRRKSDDEPRSPGQEAVFFEMAQAGLVFPANMKATNIPKYACQVKLLDTGMYRVVHMIAKQKLGFNSFRHHFPDAISPLMQIGKTNFISWCTFFLNPEQMLRFCHAREVLLHMPGDDGGQTIPQAINLLLLTFLHDTLKPGQAYPKQSGPGSKYASVFPNRLSPVCKYEVRTMPDPSRTIQSYLNEANGHFLLEEKPGEEERMETTKIRLEAKKGLPARRTAGKSSETARALAASTDFGKEKADELSSLASDDEEEEEEFSPSKRSKQ